MKVAYGCEYKVMPKYTVYRHILITTWDLYTPRVPAMHYDDDDADWGPEYQVLLTVLNQCIGKWPHLVNCGVYDMDCEFKKLYFMESYMESIHGKEVTGLSSNLDKCSRKGDLVFDPIRCEYVDMSTGLVSREYER